MPAKSRPFVPLPVFATLVVAYVACGGRTSLNAPLGATGGAGRVTGRAGQGGGGQGGASGSPAVAGQGGSGGFAGVMGEGGGGGSPSSEGLGGIGGSTDSEGFGGFSGPGGGGGAGQGGGGGVPSTGGTGGGPPGGCVSGTNSCADAHTGQICLDGVFVSFACPFGCFGGVCAECTPGASICTTEKTRQVCSDTGILHAPELCPGFCADGECTTCTDGATRCASNEGQETCKGGSWAAAVDCPFVCVNGACSKNVKHVFTTSEAVVAGDIGGLPGADDICRRLATSAGLSSSFSAWLSDFTGSPASRFSQDGGPYELVDGTIVANNWADLTSGMLRHPIDLNEKGGAPASSPDSITSFAVWTDTTPSGGLSTMFFRDGGSCKDWSDQSGTTVVIGSTEFSNNDWSELTGEESMGFPPTICSISAPLYCFEQ
jgi:hypothetical protein